MVDLSSVIQNAVQNNSSVEEQSYAGAVISQTELQSIALASFDYVGGWDDGAKAYKDLIQAVGANRIQLTQQSQFYLDDILCMDSQYGNEKDTAKALELLWQAPLFAETGQELCGLTSYFQNDATQNNLDVSLFSELLESLPDDGVISMQDLAKVLQQVPYYTDSPVAFRVYENWVNQFKTGELVLTEDAKAAFQKTIDMVSQDIAPSAYSQYPEEVENKWINWGKRDDGFDFSQALSDYWNFIRDVNQYSVKHKVKKVSYGDMMLMIEPIVFKDLSIEEPLKSVPNQEDDPHYKVQKSKAEGIQDLFNLAKTRKIEEKFYYVKIQKADGTFLEFWYEVGFAESATNATSSESFYNAVVMDASRLGQIVEIGRFHYHPYSNNQKYSKTYKQLICWSPSTFSQPDHENFYLMQENRMELGWSQVWNVPPISQNLIWKGVWTLAWLEDPQTVDSSHAVDKSSQCYVNVGNRLQSKGTYDDPTDLSCLPKPEALEQFCACYEGEGYKVTFMPE